MDALKIKVLRKSREKEGKHQTTLCLDWVFPERSQPSGRRYTEQVGWQRWTDSWFCLACRC